MLRHWFADSVGVASFVLAIATLAAAALATRFVVRRYSSRPSVVAVVGLVVGSFALLGLSAAAGTAAADRPRPLPTVSASTFAHDLSSGNVRHVVQVESDGLAAGTTVFETASGHWRQLVVHPTQLSSVERSQMTSVAEATLPSGVRGRVLGNRNLDLVAFLGIEVVMLVVGTMAVRSAADVPRRVDLDLALERLVAEHHGRETV